MWRGSDVIISKYQVLSLQIWLMIALSLKLEMFSNFTAILPRLFLWQAISWCDIVDNENYCLQMRIKCKPQCSCVQLRSCVSVDIGHRACAHHVIQHVLVWNIIPALGFSITSEEWSARHIHTVEQSLDIFCFQISYDLQLNLYGNLGKNIAACWKNIHLKTYELMTYK